MEQIALRSGFFGLARAKPATLSLFEPEVDSWSLRLCPSHGTGLLHLEPGDESQTMSVGGQWYHTAPSADRVRRVDEGALGWEELWSRAHGLAAGPAGTATMTPRWITSH